MRSCEPIAKCRACDGEGVRACPRCRGEGVIAGELGAAICTRCHGEKRVVCASCAGSGLVARRYGDPLADAAGIAIRFGLEDEPTGGGMNAGDPRSPGDGTSASVRSAPAGVQGGAR